ncbi:hypothetical protein E8A74_31600 [Polyangium fumosum]|uniref:Bacterial virulence factor lipase N-terminal domain-containing protein n=2 Tax=Polyangium fumosum TaxID=889272 RepID=A0A4V5PNS5_9BACT|nr:hypothetical protein E8A74_31600 [Polyangium fumosum]
MLPSRTLVACLMTFAGLAALGCSDDAVTPAGPPPLAVPEGCNPIAFENDCLLPYPSDFYLQDDASMPSGKRVVIPEAAQMKDKNETPFDFTKAHPIDGFSHHQPILVHFKEGVSTEGVVFHTDEPEKSLSPESKVILLDATTGKPVPVWAEVDKNTLEPSERAFLLRPFVRLDNGKRYIVALQGLAPESEAAAGPLLAPPEGFKRIRDKQTSADPVLGPIASRYEKDIFPALVAHGVARETLQLAWDFTTSSEEVNTRDLLTMRDDLLAKLEANPPAVGNVKVTETTPAENENIWLRIEGTIKVPLYMESVEPGALIHRDASGKPAQNGDADVPFILQVPHSLMPADANFEPARILQYGHGFFGLAEEINYGFMRGYENERKYIAAAVDLWGMAEPDIEIVLQKAFGDPGTVFSFIDRIHQGIINYIALSYALKGPIAALPELQRFDKPLYDTNKLFYYGISQGSIFGVTMLAVNPILDRAALGVGGGPYSLMMSRSASYQQLYGVLQGQLQNPLTLMKLMALSQGTWDRVDPMTYAPHLLKDTYPNSPPNRHVLMQIGIGDHSVNNLASHLVARATGIPLLDPAPRPIWGLESTTSPADDALVVIDFKLATEPGLECRLPTEAEKNDVHEGVRRNVKVKDQLDLFFQPDGQIQNTCDGACDPE